MRTSDIVGLVGIVFLLAGFIVQVCADGLSLVAVMYGSGFVLFSIGWTIGVYLWRKEGGEP